jgi:hypothetical protein
MSLGDAFQFRVAEIPKSMLSLMCGIHLRQDHGYKGWTLAKFKDHYPWLVDDKDDSFGFIALHYLNHVEEVALPLDENGTVAFVRLVKPPLS